MKPIIRTLGVALFLTFAACGGGVTPVGVWKIDPEATFAANQAQIEDQLADMQPADRAKAKDKFESLFKSAQGTVELGADMTLISKTLMGGKEQVMSGSWELDGDKIRMKSKVKGAAVDVVTTGAIVNGRMTVNAVGTEQFVVLTRQSY